MQPQWLKLIVHKMNHQKGFEPLTKMMTTPNTIMIISKKATFELKNCNYKKKFLQNIQNAY